MIGNVTLTIYIYAYYKYISIYAKKERKRISSLKEEKTQDKNTIKTHQILYLKN